MEQVNKPTILVAEDNESNYMFLKAILKSYNLVRAMDGLQVVELASKGEYSVILMDIKMPNMDGITATKKIREFNNNIPIIAVTANAFDSDRAEAIQAGCNDFIAKPLKKKQLEELLIRYINA